MIYTTGGAARAAEKLSSNIEHLYPWYQTVEYEVYENGALVETI